MSDKNTREEKLKIIFATYPDKNEVYMTSDDRAFFTEHQANGFAQGLADKTVEKFERDDRRPKTEDGSGKLEVGSEEIASAEGLAMTEAPVDERAALVAKYQELLGKKPSNFMKTENIEAAIAKAEADKK